MHPALCVVLTWMTAGLRLEHSDGDYVGPHPRPSPVMCFLRDRAKYVALWGWKLAVLSALRAVRALLPLHQEAQQKLAWCARSADVWSDHARSIIYFHMIRLGECLLCPPTSDIVEYARRCEHSLRVIPDEALSPLLTNICTYLRAEVRQTRTAMSQLYTSLLSHKTDYLSQAKRHRVLIQSLSTACLALRLNEQNANPVCTTWFAVVRLPHPPATFEGMESNHHILDRLMLASHAIAHEQGEEESPAEDASVVLSD